MLEKIISFGYKHRTPRAAHGVVVVDVRNLLNNPHHNPDLRPLTGLDFRVKEAVQATPAFSAIYDHLRKIATAPGVTEVHFGCVGGKHRSVVVAEMLSKDLNVPVQHQELPIAIDCSEMQR